MKRKIYKLLSSAKQGLFAFALTVFSGTAYSQTTYTLSYTGGLQTFNLQAGTIYTIETWGAGGGDNLGNGSTTFLQTGGKGGYSKGTYSVASSTPIYVCVGGKGGSSISTLNTTVTGGYNGGGYGSLNTTSGKASGAGGGGATHVATATGTLGTLVSNQPAVLIVAGGGGGAGESNYVNSDMQYNSNGGNGGGTAGLQDIASGYQGRMGQGGTQSAGGTGGDNGSAIATGALQGIFGVGGYNPISGANTTAGGSGIGGGGGGWYGGGAGWGGAATSFQAGSGGGGSGHIGGIISGTTTAFGQTGFVTNPDVTGNGRVVITEGCSISLTAAGLSIGNSLCSGNSITLTTNAASNYTWSNGNTATTSIVVSPTVSQTYSVIGTSTAACQTAATISITVNSALPVVTITNTPNSICLGKTATLTAGGALSYTWAGGPGGVINGQTFTPTATSNYTVTGQNGCGITTSITTITVAPLPVTINASSTLVCSGSPATLTAASAVTGYTWYPVAIPNVSVIVGPTVNTVYTVVASDGTCSGVAMISLNTKPNPTLTIAASNQTVCEGAVVTMTASGALSYTWTSPVSNAPNISDNPTAPTLYQVSGTNSVNCISSTSQIIFTDPTPTIAITSNKTIVCSGDPVTLTASGATTYNWTGGPPTAGNVVNPTSNTTYTASGTTGNCTGSQTIIINVLTASVTTSVSIPSVCNGVSTNLHAGGATSYVWVGLSSFNGNVTVTPSVTTVYIVNATTTAAGLSCPSSSNITVTVFNNPTVTIAATKTVVCKSDPNIVLTAGGATTYTWSTATVSANISVHPQSSITYTITGVDANGCMNTASQLIQVNTCSGIAELTDVKNSISIYPNPNNGTFMLKSDADMDLILVNELGQHLRSLKLQESANFSVEVKDLKPGIYFIVNEKGSGTAVQKIVVN